MMIMSQSSVHRSEFGLGLEANMQPLRDLVSLSVVI